MFASNTSVKQDFKRYLISEDASIIEALKKIDETSRRILFVIKEDHIVASITDGDVRRFILSQGNLKSSVKDVANYTPKVLNVSEVYRAKKFLEENVIDAVPIIDDEYKIVDIVFSSEYNKESKEHQTLKAPIVMMAGGKGTRLYPYTKILPKPLIPIGEIPIAEHIINGFSKLGCRDFYLIVNYKKNMLKAYFNELDRTYNVHYIDEEKPLGTGGGISLINNIVTETFFLTNCDILIKDDFKVIYDFHKEKGNMITMICSLKNFQIPYGIVELNSKGEVASMLEKPHVPFLTNTGCYVVEPEVINYIPIDTPIDFPDIMQLCQQRGGKVGVFPISEDSWLDMGVPDEMERMRERLNL